MTDRELQDLRNLGHDDAADEIERLHAEVDSWSQQASDRAQDALDLVAAERERCAKAVREAIFATPGRQRLSADILIRATDAAIGA